MIRFFITMIWYSILSISAVTFAQLSTIDHTSPSITQSIDHVVDTNNISNPLRQGTRFPIESPDGNNILDVMNISEIRWFDQAQNETLHLIRNIINIILSFTAVVVLVLLLIEWYKIVTSGTDTDQYKKAFWKLKNYAIAVAGIAVSWFIVSFIFAALGSII